MRVMQARNGADYRAPSNFENDSIDDDDDDDIFSSEQNGEDSDKAYEQKL